MVLVLEIVLALLVVITVVSIGRAIVGALMWCLGKAIEEREPIP